MASPILVHWQILARRWEEYAQFTQPGLAIVGGVYPYDRDIENFPLPRWSNGRALLKLNPPGDEPVDLRVRYFTVRPSGPPAVHVSMAGRYLETGPPTLVAADAWQILAQVPAARARSGALLAIESDTWVPSQVMASNDGRTLGIYIAEIQASQSGRLLVLGVPWIDLIPVSQDRPWSRDARAWFWTREHQLVSNWIWHLYQTELPAELAWLALLPLAGLLLGMGQIIQIVRPPVSDTHSRTALATSAR
jgi:hypothetical protein